MELAWNDCRYLLALRDVERLLKNGRRVERLPGPAKVRCFGIFGRRWFLGFCWQDSAVDSSKEYFREIDPA